MHHHNHPSHSNLYHNLISNQDNNKDDSTSSSDDDDIQYYEQRYNSDHSKQDKITSYIANVTIDQYSNIKEMDISKQCRLVIEYLSESDPSYRQGNSYIIDEIINNIKNVNQIMLTKRTNVQPYFKLLIYCGLLIYNYDLDTTYYTGILISFYQLLISNKSTNYENFPVVNARFEDYDYTNRRMDNVCLGFIYSTITQISNNAALTKGQRLNCDKVLKLISIRDSNSSHTIQMNLMPAVLIVLGIGIDKNHPLSNINLFFKIALSALTK